ncbi:MAG TPA: cation transporter [Flavihumibacter sp.]
MPDLKFSTNIKCSGCVEKITPYLNELVGTNNWSVDLNDPERTLTITHAQPISAKAVIAALEKAGYQAKTTSNQ